MDDLPPNSPKLWGPPLWDVLTLFSLAYPETPSEAKKQAHAIWINILPQILPCDVCDSHLEQYLKVNPIEPALENRDKFYQWVVDLQEDIKTQGKRKSEGKEEEGKDDVKKEKE